MNQRLGVFGLAMLALLIPSRLLAQSTPVITGQIQGIQLCQESLCGSTVFVGQFQGQVGDNPDASGGVVVAVNHEPLSSNPGVPVAITGGSWVLATSANPMSGSVLGGTLMNNGNNTFTVTALLQVLEEGQGAFIIFGLLSHNQFPPALAWIAIQP